MALHAEVSLAAPNASPLGEQRIALLEAVGREGSISGAARSLGLSYRGAWDAIFAMNNLVGRPLVAGQTGGRRGGGASLTQDGLRLIESFHRLQLEMARAFRTIAPDLSGAEDAAARPMSGGFLRTSARNALRGKVVSIVEGPVNAELGLEIAENHVLIVTLTSRSRRELGLFPGRSAIALVKAPMIVLEPASGPDAPRVTNRIGGVVASVEQDETSTEIILDIGGGKMLCAILSLGAGAASAFAPGDRASALIDPAHVILAVE